MRSFKRSIQSLHAFTQSGRINAGLCQVKPGDIEPKTIISKYYSDDIPKTIDTLKETFLEESDISIEFTDDTLKPFLTDVAQLLGRRLIEDAQEEGDRNKKSRG